MLRIEVRFPLGAYCALAPESFGQPEWPPSPVRLIGALLAAAHEAEAIDTEATRAVLQRICEAGAPRINAPKASWFDDADVDGRAVVAMVRGASRWAPRNDSLSELKKNGLSPRNVARDRKEVHKGGVVVGDQPIAFTWPDLELDADELRFLRQAAGEVTFIGTSRSPARLHVSADPSTPSEAGNLPVWVPAPGVKGPSVDVRIPTRSLIPSFDARHEARRHTGKKPVVPSGHVPNLPMGAMVPYMLEQPYRRLLNERPLDPEYWGDIIVLELDGGARPDRRQKEYSASDLRPKGAATYLVARAFREALLGAYGPVGSDDEAPPMLRGHGEEPHVAIVPLPFVGSFKAKGPRSAKTIQGDGIIRGFAIVLPGEARLPDVAEQRLRLEAGLKRFVLDDSRRWIDVPGAGRLFLRLPRPGRPLPWTIRESRYRGPSRVWETVIPIVHAHRRTSTGPRGLQRQVAADCEHVGLPAPMEIEVLDHPPIAGSPWRLLPLRAIPQDWQASAKGPQSHLRLTFDRPIQGPVILGRARHFGAGLCLPVDPAQADAEPDEQEVAA